MAGTYKTPGVYVEEITKLPPSVAEVDTAVPAFVGYTEFAKRYVDDDLIKIPTRIKSLLEYEQYFGQGPSYTSIHDCKARYKNFTGTIIRAYDSG